MTNPPVKTIDIRPDDPKPLFHITQEESEAIAARINLNLKPLVEFVAKGLQEPSGIVLWVGAHEHVIFHSKNQGVKNPRVVSRLKDAVGFNGPLEIHLCGEWQDLPEWPSIQSALRSVEQRGGSVEWIKHY